MGDLALKYNRLKKAEGIFDACFTYHWYKMIVKTYFGEKRIQPARCKSCDSLPLYEFGECCLPEIGTLELCGYLPDVLHSSVAEVWMPDVFATFERALEKEAAEGDDLLSMYDMRHIYWCGVMTERFNAVLQQLLQGKHKKGQEYDEPPPKVDVGIQATPELIDLEPEETRIYPNQMEDPEIYARFEKDHQIGLERCSVRYQLLKAFASIAEEHND